MYGEGSPMAQVVSSRYYSRPIPSQSHRDVTEERYRDLRHPRRVRFYCNGDRYFRGKKLYITPHRYLSFNDLLGDLTSKLPKTVPLPYGVRQIYTPVGGRKVQEIEELQDGEAYVCAGFEPFKAIRYGREELEPWSTGRVPNAGNQGEGNYGTQSPGTGAYNYGFGAFRPNRHLRQTYPSRRSYGTFGSRKGPASYWGTDKEPVAGGVKPKVVTVVRNGPKPRNNVKILLNRRSVQSFEQMVLDIAEAFGPKWKNSRVRKLYTVRGKEVQAVSDFFRDDDLFIAVGNETMTKGDILDMLDELYPDSSYAKNLAKEWDKARKKRQNAAYRYKGDDDLGPDEVKRDSGLGSDASNRDERDEIVHLGKPDFKPKKHKKLPYMKDGDLMMRIEKERLRAAEEERERARRRLQKRLEAERRALDEERRKRGLVPIGPVHDPFKKMQEEKEKEREKERQRREEEEARLEEEERERLEKERKKQASPKKVKPFEAPKVIVVVKDDNGDQSGRSSEVRKSRKDQEMDSDSESRSRSRSKKEKRKKSRETESRTGESDKENRTSLKSYDGYEADDDDSHRRKGTSTDENANKTKDDEKNANDEDTPPKKEKRKKSKSKVVHKTKLERQISNADHVLEKYVAGKTLGDGNFAIVKQCTLRGASNEYAMKIVDKSKLKGKEHMIENEIAIMKQCSHPNIVKLVEEFETKSEIYLIMELVKGGDLFDAITQSVKFNEPDSAGMVRDLCNALFYLHSRKIVHRDLKPENLLVCRNKDGSVTLKLADFGLAMDVTEPIYTVCGTPTYVAPEILSEIGYGLEVDMWATGVISYILLCGFPPFRSPDRNQTELFEFIKAGEYEFLSPYWDNISKAAKDMIERLLVVDKKKRYTSVDTLCHPWIITNGGKSHPPDNMESYRKNQRRNLEAEAKMNLESYQRNKHG